MRVDAPDDERNDETARGSLSGSETSEKEGTHPFSSTSDSVPLCQE